MFVKELYSLFWSQLFSNTFHLREGLGQNENVKILQVDVNLLSRGTGAPQDWFQTVNAVPSQNFNHEIGIKYATRSRLPGVSF